MSVSADAVSAVRAPTVLGIDPRPLGGLNDRVHQGMKRIEPEIAVMPRDHGVLKK
jgi:hypothetical protein